jgi:hypothetical protein
MVTFLPSAPQFVFVNPPQQLLVPFSRCRDGAVSLEESIFQLALPLERSGGGFLGFVDFGTDPLHVSLSGRYQSRVLLGQQGLRLQDLVQVPNAVR